MGSSLQFPRLWISGFAWTLVALAGFGLSSCLGNKPWSVQTSSGSVVIDRAVTGQILYWKAGGKTIVDTTTRPASPLLLAMEDGTLAEFESTQSREESGDAGHTLVIEGTLRTDEAGIPAVIRYEVDKKTPRIAVTISTSPHGKTVRGARSFQWKLPLALADRKRVYFRGEHALDWETRYFYQFFAKSEQLLPRPDRNEWRWFGLDQLTPQAFRLWKAESKNVSALVMQEGTRLPPYVQIYDAEGGVTVEYPLLARQAPKSLRVDARGGAEAFIDFLPRFLAGAETDVSDVFHQEHRILLTAASGPASLLAQRDELNRQFAGDRRPAAGSILDEPEWLRATPLSSEEPHYVTGGYPFHPGEWQPAAALRVVVGEKSVPYQAKPLAYWPDGSIKWALLTFPVNPGQSVAECPPPRVSFRDGKFLPVSIAVADHAEHLIANDGPRLSAAAQPGGAVEILNGPQTILLKPGRDWLSVRHGGASLVGPGALAYASYVDGVKAAAPFLGLQDGGVPKEQPLVVEEVKLEETGPLRTVVRLEGMAEGSVPTRMVIRITCEAGRPEIQLTHSVEFLLKDPRKTFLTSLGVAMPLPGRNPGAIRFGGLETPVEGDEAELLQQTPFARVIRTVDGRRLPVRGRGGWLEVTEKGRQFLGIIRNFRETAPKAISAQTSVPAARFELWPQGAGWMDVRRYSDYPHLGQGEATPADDDWVQKSYYPNDPFVGISRTHDLLFGFRPETSAVDPAACAADFESPPLLYAGWERYQSTGVVLPAPARTDWPRAWDAWTDFVAFWLFHRELHSWYGFWDFGDFRHHFRSGYGWIVPPEVLASALQNPASSDILKGKQIADYLPPNDWAYDNGRCGWSNSEGLPNLFLQQEYLRNGNRAVYFAAEAMARFTRDVVVRHGGKWFGAGTRHGVQHWSDGGHEERQTTSTEFRLHYFLSGDGRTRDVVHKLYDQFYSKAPVSGEAQHSGRWGGLLFHLEMTGSQAEADQLRRYAHAFIAPDGLYLRPNLSFPGPIAKGEPEKLNGGSMFFHTYGAMHNLIEYQQITGDADLAAAIIKMADAVIRSPEIARSYAVDSYSSENIYFPPVAFAALHADDPKPYRSFLETWMKGGGWRRLYQTVSRDPRHWSGETAFLHGNMPGCFFWMNWAPYVTKALGKDALWNAEISEEFNRVEKAGKPSRQNPLSWQSEFDGNPGLSGYTDSQKPWYKAP